MGSGVARTATRAHPDSSPETSVFRGLSAVGILPEAPRLLMSSCISASGTVNQRPFGARGLSMCGETIREHARERRPGTRPRHSAGLPQETFAHATPCRKTAYARRKTRTPRPCGRGVHSEPFGEPLSRSPLEVADEGWCDERCFRNPETRRPDAVSRHVHERRGLLEAAVAFQMTRPSGSTDCGVADRSSTPARGGSSSPLRIAFRDGSAGSGTILMPRIRCSLNRGPAKGQRHTSYQRDSGPSTRRNNPPSRRISSAVTRPRDGVSPLFSTGGRSPR